MRVSSIPLRSARRSVPRVPARLRELRATARLPPRVGWMRAALRAALRVRGLCAAASHVPSDSVGMDAWLALHGPALVIEIGQDDARHSLSKEALDRDELPLLFRRKEGKCVPDGVHASRSADPVHVILGRVGYIVVHDVGDALYVDPT